MRSLLLILLSLLFITSCSKDSPDNTALYIGFTGAISGQYSKYPLEMKRAVALAIEEKNASGGVLGRPVKLIADDDEGRAEQTLKSAERLLDKNLAALINGGASDTALSISMKAELAKTLLICPALSLRDLPGKGDYTFPMQSNRDIPAHIAARYAFFFLHAKRAAVVYTKDDHSLSLASGFKNIFDKAGGKILIFSGTERGEQLAPAVIEKIKTGKIDMIYTAADAQDLPRLIKQIRSSSIRTQILSGSTLSEQSVIDACGPFADGVLFTAIEHDSAAKGFSDAFSKRYRTDAGHFAAAAYDAAQLVFSAVEKSGDAKTLDRQLIRKTVAETKLYKGASGEFTMAPGGQVIRKTALYEIQKGKAVYKKKLILNDRGILSEER